MPPCRDLHRRRFASEHKQPVAGSVTGKVDQDVDAVGPDLLGQSIIRRTYRRTPILHGLLQPGGGAILALYSRVAIDLERRSVVRKDHRTAGVVSRVRAKVR